MKMLSDKSLKRALFAGFGVLLIGVAYVAGSQAHRPTGPTAGAQLGKAERILAAGDGKLAAKLLTPLAEKGNAEADYWLADIYSHGIGIPANPRKAIDYLTQAAGKGHVQAQLRLGEIYVRGEQTVQDFGQARIWLSKAAQGGNANAARELGRIYEKGLGVARDPIAAYAWYEIAVLRGDPQADRLRDDVVATLDPAQMHKAEAQVKTLNAGIGKAA